MKKKWLILLSLIILVFASFFNFTKKTEVTQKADMIQLTTPTLFFHGYGSSSNAEKHMASAAKKKGVTNTIIEANVDMSGNVTLKGTIAKKAINPIVLVNYEDNENTDYQTDAAYAKAVVLTLKETYGFRKMNMVGHSMGNMSIAFYSLYYSGDEKLPKLMKQVAIAGPFNGVIGYNEPENVTLDSDGRPSQMTEPYEELLGLRQVFPDRQVDVLNIYGDIGNQSDELVSTVSARSLKYLLGERVKSYQELKITGAGGQHSALHRNADVDQALIHFLWGKS